MKVITSMDALMNTGRISKSTMIGWVLLCLSSSVVAMPSVVETVPANSAIDVAVDAPITLRFSERMDVATLSSEAITLTGPAGPTPIKIEADAAGKRVF